MKRVTPYIQPTAYFRPIPFLFFHITLTSASRRIIHLTLTIPQSHGFLTIVLPAVLLAVPTISSPFYFDLSLPIKLLSTLHLYSHNYNIIWIITNQNNKGLVEDFLTHLAWAGVNRRLAGVQFTASFASLPNLLYSGFIWYSFQFWAWWKIEGTEPLTHTGLIWNV